MLGMAGMSSYWNKLGRKHVETLAGREVTLLERLHRKLLASFDLVTEEITIPNSPSQSESSMDSAMNFTVQETTMHVIPSPSKNIVKTEPDNMKPLPSSIRSTLWSKRKAFGEKIVSLEGVMNCPDKVIDFSSPKCKRTTRGSESKPCDFPSFGGHSSSEPINPELAYEKLATTVLHECLVVTDTDLKHAEENVPSFEVEPLGLDASTFLTS
ncbi:unnamed protein product [Lactuca virosa]|uniref:Uncharacterized protein n=1 Tax=Lactuca virosa TaxID=75947 RepID=A0AAU9NJL8_9ASTR|nr:unnamed protein product [Lactuca virosa]